MRRSDRQGFTLIELLVVIAIIAILAAILFPVFMAAKEKAKIGVCCEHQKQLIAAFHRYADDWNNMTCTTYNQPTASPSGRFWSQLLFPYTSKNPYVFSCAGLKNTSDRREIESGASFTIMGYTSIGMSIAVGDIPGKTSAVKLSEFRSPTQTLILACSSTKNYGFYAKHGEKYGCAYVSPGRQTQPLLCKAPEIELVVNTRLWDYDLFDSNRHKGSVAVAYLDGHVAVHTQKWVLSPHRTDGDWTKPDFSIWDR